MIILHEADLRVWEKVDDPFNEAGKFKKRLWHQKFRDPVTGENNEYVLIAQPDWAITCPILPNGDVILVQEWKQGCECVETVFPAGEIDTGEIILDAGKRETEEETGFISDKVILLGSSFIATRSSPTRYHMYVALNCRSTGTQTLDSGEYVRVIQVSQKEFWQMVDDGDIKCGCCIDLAARAVRHGYLDPEAMLQC